MGRPKLYHTLQQKLAAKSSYNRKWYEEKIKPRNKLFAASAQASEHHQFSPENDCEMIENLEASVPSQIPNRRPPSLVERLFEPPRFHLPIKLHVLYLVMYVVYLSHKMTDELSSVMFRVTDLALNIFGVRTSNNKESLYKRVTRHYRQELFGKTHKIFYCFRCKNIIPANAVNDQGFMCRCGKPFKKQTNFISVLSVRHALTTLLQTTAQKWFPDTRSINADCSILRHCSGETIRRMNLQNTIFSRDLAVDLFIDNAQIGKFRKKATATLVQLSVANVGYQISRTRIICAAIWYAKSAEQSCPYSIILSVVVDQLLDLFHNPIIWWNGNQRVSSRVLLRAAITDMKAKADMLAMTHPNGYYSCPYCVCRGELQKRSKKTRATPQHGTQKQAQQRRVHLNNCTSSSATQVRTFSCSDNTLHHSSTSFFLILFLQNDSNTRERKLQSRRQGPNAKVVFPYNRPAFPRTTSDFRTWQLSNGHKMECELLRLPYVKLPGVATVDVMHLFRNLAEDVHFFFRNKFKLDDNIYEQLSRLYRTIQHFPSILQYMTHDFFELSEKTSSKEIIMQFMLTFPLLIRRIHISDVACRVVDHLAAIMYIFLSDEITQNVLVYAKSLTQDFVDLWVRHAGLYRCTPTKHALLHLVEAVLRHGPLIFVSAFMHESNFLHINRRISTGMRLSAVIHNNIHHASAAKHFLHDALTQSAHFLGFSRALKVIGPLRKQKDAVKCGQIKFMGQLSVSKISRHTRHQIQTALSRIGGHVDETTFYTSFSANNSCEFFTAESCVMHNSQHKDSMVVDVSGNFWNIQYGFSVPVDGNRFAGALANKINCTDSHWSCFPSLGHDTPLQAFCIKGKASNQLHAISAADVRYYALNVSTLVANNLPDNVCLIKIPFAITLS